MPPRKEQAISFCGSDIDVRELTVTQIAEILDTIEEKAIHVLDLLMEHGVPVRAVMASSGLTEQQLMDATPSELDDLYTMVQQVNPSLAVMTDRLTKAVEAAAAITAEKPSGSSPASS